MKKLNWMLSYTAATLALLIPVGASAAPLDPSRVPTDAKWVIHVDLEALGKTHLADQVRENRPHILTGVRMLLQNRYGVDLREGLDSVTLYSNDYTPHSGTMVLRADYDQRKVQSNLEARADVQKETRGEYTFYKITKGYSGDTDRARFRQGRDNDKDRADFRERRDSDKQSPDTDSGTARRGRGDRGDRVDRVDRQLRRQHVEHPVTVVLVDSSTIVFSSSDDKALAAIALVKGDSDQPAKKASPLLSKLTEATIFYGAARDLGEIKENHGFFPILSQHKQIYIASGAKDDQVFKDITLIAKSEDVAEDMEKAIEGLNALGNVWAADSKALKTVIANREVTRNGTTVHAVGECDRETAAKAIDELCDRFMQRFDIEEEKSTSAERK